MQGRPVSTPPPDSRGVNVLESVQVCVCRCEYTDARAQVFMCICEYTGVHVKV